MQFPTKSQLGFERGRRLREKPGASQVPPLKGKVVLSKSRSSNSHPHWLTNSDHPFSDTGQGAVVGAKEEERVTSPTQVAEGQPKKGPTLPAFVSWGHHNKAPQTGGFKQQKHSLSPFWRPEIGNAVSEGRSPFRGSGGGPVLCLLQLWVAACLPQLMATTL